MSGRLPAALLVLASVGLAACSTPSPAEKPGQGSARTTSAQATPTQTLPPPPAVTRPAPSSAGELTADSLPAPPGWRTIARKGGVEEGYKGNGTWVHARDPRYAASDVISLGCTEVTRDDYADPTGALEGTYTKNKGDAGVGLALQFASSSKAAAFFDLYVRQVRACRGAATPLQAKAIVSDLGLIDRRSYPDGEWTEVARQQGSRVTLVILSDPGHRITTAQSEALLQQIAER